MTCTGQRDRRHAAFTHTAYTMQHRMQLVSAPDDHMRPRADCAHACQVPYRCAVLRAVAVAALPEVLRPLVTDA